MILDGYWVSMIDTHLFVRFSHATMDLENKFSLEKLRCRSEVNLLFPETQLCHFGTLAL